MMTLSIFAVGPMTGGMVGAGVQLLCNLIVYDYLKLLGKYFVDIPCFCYVPIVFTIVLSTQLQSSQPLQSAISSQR